MGKSLNRRGKYSHCTRAQKKEIINLLKENKMAKKNIDPSTFLFRNTTVEKFLKNMDAKNKPGKKRENSFEGPMGTGFKTKKPKTTA